MHVLSSTGGVTTAIPAANTPVLLLAADADNRAGIYVVNQTTGVLYLSNVNDNTKPVWAIPDIGSQFLPWRNGQPLYGWHSIGTANATVTEAFR
jgi:hypothetical protein